MYNPSDYFTEDEINQIRRLGVSVRNNIIPLQYKDFFYIGSGQIWDIDTYTAEACQCLALKEEEYLEYLYPRRFNENVVNPEMMKTICYGFKIKAFLKLKTICDFADTIIICEAGRGIDVLLAVLVKRWKRIIAYDQDKSVLYEMNNYFRGTLHLPFEPQQINSTNYNFEGITEKSIILGTCHNVSSEKQKEIAANVHLLGIFDGEIVSNYN